MTPNQRAAACRRRGAKQKNRGGVVFKTVYAVVVAAIVAAAFVAFPSLSWQVEARAPGAKADRADTRPLATQCSQRGWPYFEAACLRDTRNTFGLVREVRIVSADRLPPAGAGARR
jgi:hypothetical protein